MPGASTIATCSVTIRMASGRQSVTSVGNSDVIRILTEHVTTIDALDTRFHAPTPPYKAVLGGHVQVISVPLGLSVVIPLACASTRAVDTQPSFQPFTGPLIA